jgi:PKD repeat protein
MLNQILEVRHLNGLNNKMQQIRNFIFIKILIVFIGFTRISYSQTSESQGLPCGTVDAVNKALEEHPELIENIKQLDRETKEYLVDEKLLDSTITIPVVFHVAHTYGSERISEAQIKDCIRIMNQDFQKRNADTATVSSLFKPLIGTAQMRFRLAKKDPNGRCTKGINYIFSYRHVNGDETLKSQMGSWDTRKYLNIWVCSNIASGAGAYSYYPGTAPGQNAEGILTRNSQLGSIGTSSTNLSSARTIPHETGHFFNLPHTWGNSNTPGAASNCNIDDGVTDTPTCSGTTSGCNLMQNTCGQIDNVENIMDYSSCPRMFTKGQVLRMHAAVRSGVAFRNQLWSGANLISTGTTNDGPGDECPPTPDFRSNISRVCINQNITFTQLAYNVNNPNDIQFKWVFTGGTPEISNAKIPVVSYAQPGKYPVKLVVSNSAGADSIIRNDFVSITLPETAYLENEVESFENATFPVNSTEPLRAWEIDGQATATTWRRNPTAGFSGGPCLSIANTSNTTIGFISTLYSPVFEILGPNSGARVSFKYAFRRRAADDNDRLTVSFSSNCGLTWFNVFNKLGAPLATTTTLSNNAFIPSPTDWKQENLTISGLGAVNKKIMLRFTFTGGGGGNIYLDDVAVANIVSVGALVDDRLTLRVVPNPSEDLPKVLVNMNKESKGKIEIMDVIGRTKIYETEMFLSEGETELNLESRFLKPKSGNYWIRLVLPDKVLVKQWVVLP